MESPLAFTSLGNDPGHAAIRGLRVLVLDEWIPFPPDCGKRVRTWNLLRRLSSRHKISVLCYGDSESEAARTVLSEGIALHTVPALPDFAGWRLYGHLLGNLFSRNPYSVSKHDTRRFRDGLRRMIESNKFDLIHFEWTPYANFMDSIGKIPSLIMAHNIESQIWSRRAQHGSTFVHRCYFARQARKMRKFEQAVLRRADEVATVTAQDAEQVRQWGVKHVSIVENGVDLEEFTPTGETAAPAEILCLGSLDWQPNLDAVGYLIDEIMPLIIARIPHIKLRIVGRHPPLALQNKLANLPWTELVGEVPDVRPYFARGTVVVVPLRIGGGSRIKILEALAMGKAVVSTTIGAEGLAVSKGVHLLLGDTPADFARQTMELLNSPEQRASLGEQGRQLVEERYGWDCAAKVLETAWLRLAGRPSNIENPAMHAGQEAKATP